ncbi:M23 family metallopeptidase [Romboutsia sp. 1001216sp1]|uniref:M23 family metallopeptidase n=1 Tax=Romboutsia sp. 1001216sp1 TaxID=2986997 RepID=UPI00232DA965|nr:M23 family metallopeptidase [Romboutsia sp. 1001216sp1]MDB8806263.1 M23 family metallopeptidase [Romboutsia sp. 1001216sp1]MDB8808961.1 M23 family metallopeptidase [Romboutsia sp. 1001216sp1]MDB8811911.1 M23 family metallopeptidase [Romboutsia sp. 1001216sp1]MDB8817657.1 M23 family metallopeptidase [Romboutsia sp. 1001216sp1]MDB8820439.1 M23 family metallopeptidase [Romboutsia sp. 1001216sp1]
MKKLLEKDGFYLALFVCISLLAVGGVWFVKNDVNDLASNNEIVNDKENSKKEDEVHLIENENKDAVPTSTESKENLETAKNKEVKKTSKLEFVGEKVIREYSAKEPSYSETLNLWEVHKGLDVSCKEGQSIKSLLSGKVTNIFKDDANGMSVEVESEGKTVIYSNLSEDIKVKDGQAVKEGDVIALAGNTSVVESAEGPHIHIEAFKGKESIDPMSLIK